MHPAAELAVWLAAMVAGWTLLTGFAGATVDERVARSGSRGLHAAAVLLTFALGTYAWAALRDLRELPLPLAAAVAIRALWTDGAVRVLFWAWGTAIFASLVPRVSTREPGPDRVAAARFAATAVLLLAGAAVAARAVANRGAGGGEMPAPLTVHTWAGVAGRLLFALGCCAAVVPLSLRRMSARGSTPFRWALTALALCLAGALLDGWVAYALVTAPPELDAAGAPMVEQQTSRALLWMLPPLLLAALASLSAGRRPTPPGSPAAAPRAPSSAMVATLMLVLAGVVGLTIAGPAAMDWTAGRTIEPGIPLTRTLVFGLLLPALVACAALVVNAARDRHVAGRTAAPTLAGGAALACGVAALAGARDAMSLTGIALSAGSAALLLVTTRTTVAAALATALLTTAAGIAASAPPLQHLELAPGESSTAVVGGRRWRLSPQGTSRDEAAAYDGAVVGIEVASAGRVRLLAPGERLYPDAAGRTAVRVSVPALAHGIAGDLRLTVRGLRGDVTLVELRYHPLAAFAWVSAALVVLTVVAAVAALPRGGRTGMAA